MVLDRANICWQRLADATSYYESIGFKYIEVPWIVSHDITKITFPTRNNKFVTFYGDLVGSAEQSFISLSIDEKLPLGSYCSLSPCFRQEPTIDNLHLLYFMKVELFKSDVVNEHELENIISHCLNFFNQHISEKDKLEVILTNDGYDINMNDIELGSYGIRKHNELQWIYATGLAEPRFSTVKKG